MTSNYKKQQGFALVIALIAIMAGAVNVLAADETPTVVHYRDSSTDRVPALTAFPTYPSVARRDRIEGEAIVCFKIKTNGKISRASVRESTHKIFSRPSLRAIKKSTFEPLGPGQIQASAKTCRTYRFRLDPIVVDVESATNAAETIR
jgi:TonB family protein